MLNQLLNLINEKKTAEAAVKSATNQLKEAIKSLDMSVFAELDYETTKSIYDAIHYYAEKETEKELEKILAKKKAEKYPELLKPTYYPEIDTLDISDEEKLRLDSAARANVRAYFSLRSLHRLNEPFTKEDVENLYKLGIITKVYRVECEKCGDMISTYSEEEWKKHRRAFELHRINVDERTEEIINELDKLEQDGYGYVYLCCMNCDEYEIEVTTQEEMDGLVKNAEIYYKFTKQPDLRFESL
jgi:hypothetical protein